MPNSSHPKIRVFTTEKHRKTQKNTVNIRNDEIFLLRKNLSSTITTEEVKNRL